MSGIFKLITHVIIAPSALSAINYMSRQHHSFSNPERLWFFYYGNQITQTQIAALLPSIHTKKIILLYEDDLLGRIAAIKIACWLKGRMVQVTYEIPEKIVIRFNGKIYQFPEHQLNLSRFEKQTGLRSQIKSYKTYNSNQS